MFVRKVKKPNDMISVRIVENHREEEKVKQKLLYTCGQAHKTDLKKLADLERLANSMLVKLRNEAKPTFPGMEEEAHGSPPSASPTLNTIDHGIPAGHVSFEGLREESRRAKKAPDILSVIYDRMGFNTSIQNGYKQEETDRILKKVVLEKAKDPNSRIQSVKTIKTDFGEILDLDLIYHMVDTLYENEAVDKNNICSSRLSLFKEKVSVALFDITTLYFEKFKPNFSKSGFIKGRKTKETQTMLALVTTAEGLSLGYTLFPGSTYEMSALIAAINKLQNRYDLENTYLVTDRGMFNKNNLKSLDELNVKFIVGAKIKTQKKAVKEKYLTDFEGLREKNPKKNFLIKEYDLEEKRRLILTWSRKRAKQDVKDRERLVERLNKQMSDGKVPLSQLIKNSETKKYLKISQKDQQTGEINEDKIKEDARWDGLHGLITNHTSSDMEAQEVIENYKELWQIKEAFRVNKHDLKTRSIYRYNPNIIKAHILICYMAYALSVYVRKILNENGIKLSVKRVQEELNDYQESVVVDEVTGSRFTVPSKLTPIQEEIYTAFQLKVEKTAQLI